MWAFCGGLEPSGVCVVIGVHARTDRCHPNSPDDHFPPRFLLLNMQQKAEVFDGQLILYIYMKQVVYWHLVDCKEIRL
jgi:hypothetical protein